MKHVLSHRLFFRMLPEHTLAGLFLDHYCVWCLCAVTFLNFIGNFIFSLENPYILLAPSFNCPKFTKNCPFLVILHTSPAFLKYALIKDTAGWILIIFFCHQFQDNTCADLLIWKINLNKYVILVCCMMWVTGNGWRICIMCF